MYELVNVTRKDQEMKIKSLCTISEEDYHVIGINYFCSELCFKCVIP